MNPIKLFISIFYIDHIRTKVNEINKNTQSDPLFQDPKVRDFFAQTQLHWEKGALNAFEPIKRELAAESTLDEFITTYLPLSLIKILFQKCKIGADEFMLSVGESDIWEQVATKKNHANYLLTNKRLIIKNFIKGKYEQVLLGDMANYTVNGVWDKHIIIQLHNNQLIDLGIVNYFSFYPAKALVKKAVQLFNQSATAFYEKDTLKRSVHNFSFVLSLICFIISGFVLIKAFVGIGTWLPFSIAFGLHLFFGAIGEVNFIMRSRRVKVAIAHLGPKAEKVFTIAFSIILIVSSFIGYSVQKMLQSPHKKQTSIHKLIHKPLTQSVFNEL